MLQSEYDVIVRNKRLKMLLIILTALMVAVVLFVAVKFGKEYFSTSTETPTQDTDALFTSSPEPQRTDFGTDLPTSFPEDFPIEEGATLTQSYSLDYPEQKQLSIAFPSVQTMGENFDLYRDNLGRKGWNIVVAQKDNQVALLQGVKEAIDIIISIDESLDLPSAQSQVTVSVFLNKNPSNMQWADQSNEVKIPDEDIVIQDIREFSGEEAKEFLKGDSPEAQAVRTMIESQSLQK